MIIGLNWVKWSLFSFLLLLGPKELGRSPTTTMSQAVGMNVQSTHSMRVLRMEATASSQKRLCLPSGPKLVKSSFLTHLGSCRDLGWSTVEPKLHFIDSWMCRLSNGHIGRCLAVQRCWTNRNISPDSWRRHLSFQNWRVYSVHFHCYYHPVYWWMLSRRWVEDWKLCIKHDLEPSSSSISSRCHVGL